MNSSYSAATPSILTQKQIFLLAEKKGQELGLVAGGEIEPIIKNLGGKIHYVSVQKWLETQDGSICVNGPNDFFIFLSNFSSPLRNRFTLAHELGHYFLHSDEGRIRIQAARRGSTKTEWQANWFAAAFLMPQEEFLNTLKRYNNDLDFVAAHFLVSRKAVDVRYDSLLRT
ncbi:ImmA/IrrE family metallo-endopeptidase [Leptospira koniambonensis]|uniref:ImmA/IrrE family metallo-endopeptidase n=1 Tax=Leptospira koniambonensis TaxID=2484950 RepID=A0A4R9J2D6_9LEPT|nr:ImmA/IrrE family metallo-endopeptidase [Leptospira koniambonensis]TGL28156.1 ImmA/IrrE family metallo-endopeptidase [Leptospira koniambonensis]